MATTKIVNQSILFPTAKNVDITTKIEFLDCFASEILSKQLLDGVHFAIQDGGPKSFPFKWKHWFLVSERSQLSKNVFVYNSPQKSSESFFLDVATLTISRGFSRLHVRIQRFQSIGLKSLTFQDFTNLCRRCPRREETWAAMRGQEARLEVNEKRMLRLDVRSERRD